MYDVRGIHAIVCRLLDAWEIGFMDAREGASRFILYYEGACLGGETGESIIEDTLDLCVVFVYLSPSLGKIRVNVAGT